MQTKHDIEFLSLFLCSGMFRAETGHRVRDGGDCNEGRTGESASNHQRSDRSDILLSFFNKQNKLILLISTQDPPPQRIHNMPF